MPNPMTVVKKPLRQVGESRVWLTATGLALGLGMVASLLLVVIMNGLAVFWPRVIEVLTVAKDGGSERIAGIQLQERKAVSGGEEIELYTANRDQYQLGFRWITSESVTGRERPDDLMLLERISNGNAIARPTFLVADGGVRIPAADPRFLSAFRDLLSASAVRREELLHIERDLIGGNAARIKELTLEQMAGQAHKTLTGERAMVITEEIGHLNQEFDQLFARAQELRKGGEGLVLEGEVPGVGPALYPIAELVDGYYPNRLGFFGKIGRFLHNGWSFIWENPRESNTEGGVFPAIIGTFVMTLLMSVIVVPLGVVAAIYLREYARQGLLVRSVRIAINNLAGVPSIVFGVFGLGFFVYLVGGAWDDWFFADKLEFQREPTFGTGGILWASLTLALMTVPVVIVATEEAISSVPRGMREGSLAMGASKWQTIQRIILPASVPGILTGMILAMARGAGEVAPLMLVGVAKLAKELPVTMEWPFIHPSYKFMHLGFHIYDLGFQSPDSDAARPMVFATTLLLIVLVLVLNLTAILLRERVRRRMQVAVF